MEQTQLMEKMSDMLKYQGLWRCMYNDARHKRKYEKQRAEKQRVKDKKNEVAPTS